MSFPITKTAAIASFIPLGLLGATAHAAEDFQVRYNIAGSLGGEVFAPPDQSGLAMGVAATYIDVKKVTGNDGNTLKSPVSGGTVPLPAPAPSALYPTYGANTAEVDARGTLKLYNLAIGYVTTERYAGGRVVFGANIPYGVKTQTFGVSAATPALQWNPAVPAPTQAAVQAQFNASYQGRLAAQAAAQSGEVSGIGDVELQGGWLYVDDRLRVLAGASLVLPTGRYSASAGPDIGFGNFYTLRPAVQVGYLFTPNLAGAVKITLGLNTRNKDNDLRSGNWVGLEGALAYKTSVGAIGIHTVLVQQYQDDSGNAWGASRFSSSNAGLFFTTKIPGLDAAVTAQVMKTFDSHNAKSGTFTQLRVTKVF